MQVSLKHSLTLMPPLPSAQVEHWHCVTLPPGWEEGSGQLVACLPGSSWRPVCCSRAEYSQLA